MRSTSLAAAAFAAVTAFAALIALGGCDEPTPAAGAVSDAQAADAQDTGVDGVIQADTGLDVASDAGCITGAPCDDGDPCTAADRCVDGACAPGVDLCDCAKDSDCAWLEDGDACNGTLRCDKSGPAPRCAIDPATLVTCPPDTAVCVRSSCDPKTGKCLSTPAPKGTPCIDDNPCTVDSACDTGKCVGGSASWCACESDADCTGADKPCLGPGYCDKGQFPYACKVNPAAVVKCASGKDTACLVNACVADKGTCALTPSEQVGELCVDGVGCLKITLAKPGKPMSCDDGDKCTSGDVCAKGVCTPGQTDTCECNQDSDCDSQEDGNPCTGVLYCDKSGDQKGKCVTNPATVITCASGGDTACVKNTCQTTDGSCKPTPVKSGTPCEDGDVCTKGDICLLGVCKTGTQVCPCKNDADCADKDNADKCDGTPFCDKSTGKCANNTGKQVICPTGQDSACKKAACVKTTGKCELKAIEETEEICTGTTCRRVALPKGVTGKLKSPCEDGDPCTVGDVCANGSCKAGKDTCPCVTDADCDSQDDGDKCNGTMFCNKQLGKCQHNPASVVTCPSVDDTACIKNTCQPKTGKCAPATVAGGTKCDDGDPCTKNSFCFGGLCGGGTFVCACKTDLDCLPQDDGDLCNGVPYCDKTDPKAPKCLPNPASKVFCSPAKDSACAKNTCDPKTGKCANKPATNGGPCDDGDVCTVVDTCQGGACKGKAKGCDDGNLCTKDVCKPGEGCVHTKANCADGNSCTQDLCDPKTGLCSFDAKPLEGKACDGDADGCTVGERCTKGVCGGGKPVTCVLPTKACEVASCVSTGLKSFQCIVAPAPNSQACDDGDACTLGDHCGPKGCEAGEGTPLYARLLPGPVTVGMAEVAAVWPDHDIVLAGTRGTAQAGLKGWAVTRLSQGGEERWVRQLSLPSQQIDVVPAGVWPGAKGTVVVAGTWLKGTDLGGRVLTLSPDGQQILGDVTWGSASVHERVDVAQGDGAGGAWLVGNRTVPNTSGLREGFLARINVDGKPLSGVGFGLNQVSRIGGHALRPGGGHALGVVRYGNVGQPNTCRALAMTAAGQSAWSTPMPTMNRLDGLTVLGADTVVVGAGTGPSPKPQIARLDGGGKVRWVKQLAVGGSLFAAVAQPGGGVVVGGYMGNWDKPTALLAGIGPLGSVAWQQTVTSPQAGALFDLQQDGDGALVGAGLAQLQPGNADSRRPLVLRATAWGGLVCSAAGKCLGLAPATCDDKNACTDDLCGGKGGCVHLPHSAACDDGEPCTAGDRCVDGKCKPKAATSCTGSGPCTLATCKAGVGCVEAPKAFGALCDDGDACTKADACTAKGCVGQALTCDDGVACTVDSCDKAKGCVVTPSDKACDDSNVCTDDACQPGAKADSKGCVVTPNTAPCDDGVVCTVGAVCKGGACQKGAPGKLWSADLGATSSQTYKSAYAHASSVATMPDGGYVLAATLANLHGQYNRFAFSGPAAPKGSLARRARVLRVSSTGAKLWDRLPGNGGKTTGSDTVGGVVADPEGVVVFGSTTAGAKGTSDGFAVALAAKDGARRWLFRYGDTSHEEVRGAARHGEDFIAVGATDGTPSKTWDGWLVWISKLGFQKKAALLGGSAHELLNTVAVYEAGTATRFAVAGTRKGADDDAWWAVTDEDGKLLWERVSHHAGRHDFASHIAVAPDGSVIVAGAHFAKTGTEPLLHAYLQATSATGQALWRRLESESAWSSNRHGLPIGVIGVRGEELQIWGSRDAQGRTTRRIRLSDGAVVFSGRTKGQGVERPKLRAQAGVVLADGGALIAGFEGPAPSNLLVAARSDAFDAVSCKVAGVCADKAPEDCDDGNPCHERDCTAGKCAHAANKGLRCQGKAFCTATHMCDDKGACVADGPRLFDKTVNAWSHQGGSSKNHLETRTAVMATPDGGFVTIGKGRVATGEVWYRETSLFRSYDKGGALRWADAVGPIFAPHHSETHAQQFDAALPRSTGGFVAVGFTWAAGGFNLNYSQRSYGLVAAYDRYGSKVGFLADRIAKSEPVAKHRGFHGVVRVAAGRFLAVGYSDHKGGGGPQVWLLLTEVSDAGIQVKYSELISPGAGRGVAAAMTAAGQVAVATSAAQMGYFEPATGKLIGWGKPADTTGKALDSVVPADDGVVGVGVINGAAHSGSRAGYAVRYDADRKVLWEKTYDGGGADYLLDAVALGDGRFAASGYVSDPTKGWQARLLFVAPDGQALSDVGHGGTGVDYGLGLALLADSRLVMTGQRGSGTGSNGLVQTFTAWGHSQCVTAGYCADTPLPACDDKNPCTSDTCSPGKGCVNTTLPDGHSCGSGKSCKAGVCGG